MMGPAGLRYTAVRARLLGGTRGDFFFFVFVEVQYTGTVVQ